MTLLLGPPSGGKSVLLQALSGRLRSGRNLRVSRMPCLVPGCNLLEHALPVPVLKNVACLSGAKPAGEQNALRGAWLGWL